MRDKKIVTGLIMDETTTVTFVEICEQYDIPEDFLVEMIEFGLIEPGVEDIKQATFDCQSLVRIQSAKRLKRDLGMNMPGIALALDLLDKLDRLQDELDILHRHMNNRP